MKAYIENGIKNIRNTLSWKEEDLERSRQYLVSKASSYSVKDIAHGRLDDHINEIRRQYEEVKSLHDQIETLEHILKNAVPAFCRCHFVFQNIIPYGISRIDQLHQSLPVIRMKKFRLCFYLIFHQINQFRRRKPEPGIDQPEQYCFLPLRQTKVSFRRLRRTANTSGQNPVPCVFVFLCFRFCQTHPD